MRLHLQHVSDSTFLSMQTPPVLVDIVSLQSLRAYAKSMLSMIWYAQLRGTVHLQLVVFNETGFVTTDTLGAGDVGYAPKVRSDAVHAMQLGLLKTLQ